MSKAPVTVLPKPCLKQSFGTAFCPHEAQKKHAHFPPPSQEARRYSGIEYDRTPITVAANELALPARGCPGRTFDDVDAHHYRHKRSKADHPPKSSSSHRNGDEFHPNYYFSNAAAASTWPMDLSQSQHIMLPPLSTIPGDTSESDGDISPPMSESDGQQPFLPGSVMMARGHQPRRLRKVGTANRHHASGKQRTTADYMTPPSPTSTFASCPGSNSCLGGF